MTVTTRQQHPEEPSTENDDQQNEQSTQERMDTDEANDESAPNVEEWKTKPPYSIHQGSEKFNAIYEANCHCERVKFQLSREKPLSAKLCHCTTCQVQHAAPFQWAAIFHKTDINFTHGHHNLEWYDPTSKSIEHKLPCKVRCSFCHSPIMDEGRNMILLFPTLIHMDDASVREKFKPQMHMFYEQRVIDIPDGLPKWAGINGGSDLIEDSPAEAVEEYERVKREKEKEKGKEGNGDEGHKDKKRKTEDEEDDEDE